MLLEIVQPSATKVAANRPKPVAFKKSLISLQLSEEQVGMSY